MKPRRLLYRAFQLLLAGVLLAIGLALGREATVAANPPPTAADVRSARSVFERVRLVQRSPGREVVVSWKQLATIAAMSGRAVGFSRVSLAPEDDRAHLQVSRQLPLGFWLNGHAFIAPDEQGRARIAVRIGHLPVPAFVVHGAIDVTLRVLRARGVAILPFDQMVKKIRLDHAGLRAAINLPASERAVRSLGSLDAGEVDASRIAAHYCRLNSMQHTGTTLADLVREAFVAGDGTAADNRSIFVALALLVARIDAGALPDGQAALFQRCGAPKAEFSLQGRDDLAKHWTVSAAIASSLGTDTSLALGTWKEISDSGAGGSGFSLVDLAADRSGAFSAQRGADPEEAALLQIWLSRASEANLLPVSALALAEGMTESEFRSHYADTDSDKYAATVERIDSVLAVQMGR